MVHFFLGSWEFRGSWVMAVMGRQWLSGDMADATKDLLVESAHLGLVKLPANPEYKAIARAR
jgi:hypothetical protein